MIKSYRDLDVWQFSVDLSVKIYHLTKRFPKEELFGLTSQMRRCAVSIPSNIAEGQARNTTGEFKQFLGISKGSLAELDTQTEIAKRLVLLIEEEYAELQEEYGRIGRMLNGLQKSL